MADFTVSDVLAATGGTQAAGRQNKPFTGISTDTRSIKPGNLFVALRGENFDGHDFIVRAVDNGATGVVISRQDVYVPEKVTVFNVDDTLQALQDLARFHRRRFSVPVIAITGSNGKTTTKDMVAAVLSSRLTVLKTEANYNNDIGLPQTLFNLSQEHQVAVVEMGMRGRGEIARLAAIALPTMAIITNVGETHIELLGSVANIAAAKGELVEAIGKDGQVILNADIPLVKAMRSKTKGKVSTYGFASSADFRAENVNTDTGRQVTTFECISPQGRFQVELPAVGKHNVYNALAALAAGLTLGLTTSEAAAGIKNFTASAMRLHIETIGSYKVINDAYNASPLSMAAAVETLATVATKRKVAVLGDMLELGEVAIEAHRRIGKKLAEQGVEVVVTVGELARYIADAGLAAGVHVSVACKNHEEAQEALRKLLRPGDTVLIKGSRGMKMEKILEMFSK